MLGTLIAGRYDVVRSLGAGGMATVWLARDLTLGRDVAVKLMAVDGGAAGKTALRRFVREFESCCRVSHPNVLKLFDFVSDGEGPPALVMEYLEGGRTLEEVLARDGPLDEAGAARVVRELALALEALHAVQVVHRDLKPSNVMLLPEADGGRRTVLMDFGLARALDRTALTATGALVGTPCYLPPELFSGGKAGPESDVWQLGALAYEVLAGERPFPGDTYLSVATRILSGPLPRLAPRRPDLAPRWDRFLDRCLVRDPSQRFADARALREHAERLPFGASSSSASACAQPPPSKPRSAPLLGLLLVAAALVALLALGLGSGTRSGAIVVAPGVSACAVELTTATEGPLGIAVTWRSRHPGPWRLRGSSGPAEAATTSAPGRFAATLSTADGPPTTAWLATDLPEGRRFAVSLRDLLARRIAPLEARLEAFDPAPIVQGLAAGLRLPPEHYVSRYHGEDLGSQPTTAVLEVQLAQEDALQRQAAAELRRRLASADIVPTYRAAADLAPLALGTRFLPLSQRLRLHQRLQAVQAIGLFAVFERVPVDLQPLRPGLGELGLALDARPFPADELTVYEAPDGALRLGLPLLFVPAADGERMEATFTVPRGRAGDEAELRLDVSELDRSTLRLRLNRKLEALLFDYPVLSERRSRPAHPIFQRLPPGVLLEGANRLELAFEPLFGRVCTGRTTLHRITLRLRRRG